MSEREDEREARRQGSRNARGAGRFDPERSPAWHAVRDPVRPSLPGAEAARLTRIVSAYRREVERRARFGSLAPLPLRAAAAVAPALGLALGLWLADGLVRRAPAFEEETIGVAAAEHEVVATWGDFAPPLLAELYLEDLGLGEETVIPEEEQLR